MPRKRLRPEYQLTVYKFWAKPIGKIPEVLWDTAKTMRDVWNDLVRMREETQKEIKENELDKEGRNERWLKFRNDCKVYVSSTRLNWECQEEILDRFQTASRKAIKYKQTLRESHALKKIMIPHRFTGGGVLVNRLFTNHNKSWRVKIEPVSPSAYLSNKVEYVRDRWTHGEFGLDKNNILKFETIIHRPIPLEAFIKKILWCGKFDRNLEPKNRWKWSIQIVYEYPFSKVERDDSLACGIDLGWRVMAEGSYLRIGMIVDSMGRRIELRLPLAGTGTRSTNRSQVYSQYQDFAGLIEIDSKIGNSVEDCKNKLRDILPPDKTSHLTQTRQSGLIKILRDLKDSDTFPNAQEILSKWEENDSRLRLIKAKVQSRMIGRKMWIYQNLAAWLTKTYRVIVWEGNLGLKEMAEQKEKPIAIANAAKYRQWASISNLRLWIKNSAMKNGCTILDGEAAYSTVTCWECGAETEKNSGNLFLTCANGHRHDQDEQAARNLLSQAAGLLRNIDNFQYFEIRNQGEPLDIHINLKKVTVILPQL